MSRISFVNNQFLLHEQCFVHIEDRAMQFADAAYEVILFKNNQLIDVNRHLSRLDSTIAALNINLNINHQEIIDICYKLFNLNKIDEGTVYIQISRGYCNRIPNLPQNIAPTIIATVNNLRKISEEDFNIGFKAIIEPDVRWHRCNLKTTGLLASSLANQKAKDLGFDDAIMARGNDVTEASFANVFIVDNDNNLITRYADNFILCGITRNRIIDLANDNNIKIFEKSITINDLLSAREVFLTSSSLIIRPITLIYYQNQNYIISSGQAGKITRKIRNLYYDWLANISNKNH
jgi:D-alanine transaminase